MVRDRELEQNTLSQSFVTVDETTSQSIPRKMMEDEGKR